MLLLTYLIVINAETVHIHEYGITTEEKPEIYMQKREIQKTTVYVPIEFTVPDGPLKAESQAKLHDELGKLNDDLGISDYVRNSTNAVYGCTRTVES